MLDSGPLLQADCPDDMNGPRKLASSTQEDTERYHSFEMSTMTGSGNNIHAVNIKHFIVKETDEDKERLLKV